MSRDPLTGVCETCAAAPGEPCPTATGLHWARAKAAGMTPGEMLAWRPAEGWAAEGRAASAPRAVPGPAAAGRLPNADDLGIALAALAAACDLAEQHGAPTTDVARLRDVGRSIARTGAYRAS